MLKTTNRSDLARRIARRFADVPLSEADCDAAVRAILGALAAALADGRRVEIRGFGTFNVNHRAPRLARNPKTGSVVPVPAKALPHFKPGRELQVRVDYPASMPPDDA